MGVTPPRCLASPKANGGSRPIRSGCSRVAPGLTRDLLGDLLPGLQQQFPRKSKCAASAPHAALWRAGETGSSWSIYDSVPECVLTRAWDRSPQEWPWCSNDRHCRVQDQRRLVWIRRRGSGFAALADVGVSFCGHSARDKTEKEAQRLSIARIDEK